MFVFACCFLLLEIRINCFTVCVTVSYIVEDTLADVFTVCHCMFTDMFVMESGRNLTGFTLQGSKKTEIYDVEEH